MSGSLQPLGYIRQIVSVRRAPIFRFQAISRNTFSLSSSFVTTVYPESLTPIQNVTNQQSSENIPTVVNLLLYQRQSDGTQESQLCGFPGFCAPSVQEECANITLRDCSQCSMIGAGFFAFIVVLLALLIVSGNLVVMYSTIRMAKPNFYHRIKFSLAIADILTGIQILFVTMYHFSWTINSSANTIDQRQEELHGSSQAVAGGIFYFVGFTSSLYHLVYLAFQRLYAIKWPIRYMLQKPRRLWVGLAFVWICSVVTTTVPLWFPNVLVFTYYHTAFIFSIAMAEKSEPSHWPRIAASALVLITTVIPFLLMVGFSVATSLYGSCRSKKSTVLRKSISGSKPQPGNSLRKELHIFRTVAIMQLGFTLTLIPVVVVTILSYVNYLSCKNISLVFLICIYLSMSNSLVNVLVYSVRDEAFRSTVKHLLHVFSCGQKCTKIAVPTTSVSSQYQGNNSQRKLQTSLT